MAGKIDIINFALRIIGAAPITAITEDSEAARIADDVWDICVDDVLADHNWNFATCRATLAEDAESPDFGYDNQFVLPINPYCLRVIRMADIDTEYKVEGRLLLCNDSEAQIIYIGRITDTTEFSPKFVSVLAARLAAEMAYPLLQSVSKRKLAMDDYKMKLVDARCVDGMEGSVEKIEAEEWIEARNA